MSIGLARQGEEREGIDPLSFHRLWLLHLACIVLLASDSYILLHASKKKLIWTTIVYELFLVFLLFQNHFSSLA